MSPKHYLPIPNNIAPLNFVVQPKLDTSNLSIDRVTTTAYKAKLGELRTQLSERARFFRKHSASSTAEMSGYFDFLAEIIIGMSSLAYGWRWQIWTFELKMKKAAFDGV